MRPVIPVFLLFLLLPFSQVSNAEIGSWRYLYGLGGYTISQGRVNPEALANELCTQPDTAVSYYNGKWRCTDTAVTYVYFEVVLIYDCLTAENGFAIDGGCIPVPVDCSEAYDSTTGECPGCPEGTSYRPWAQGSVFAEEYCTVDLPPFDEPCQQSSGVWNDTKVICQEDQNECENYGTFGIGNGGASGTAENPEPICIPNLDDPLPQCQTGEVLRYNDITGDAWCSLYEPNDLDPEDLGVDEPKDTDGDGIPDNQDDDIDGDGIPNSTDNDADGDGVDNEDDIDPFGEGTGPGEGDSVSGGGNCEAEPSCTGNSPIECAILIQTWKTNCSLNEEVDWEAEFSGFISSNDPGSLFGPDVDLQSELSGIYNQSAGSQSCPAGAPLNLLGTTFTFDYQPICDVADGINPIMLVIFSLLGFRVIMRAFQ